jgi:hypothetical protein
MFWFVRLLAIGVLLALFFLVRGRRWKKSEQVLRIAFLLLFLLIY